MDATIEISSSATKHGATLERTSERELVVTRTVNAPARIAFEAWTRADLLQQWWVPKSYPITLLSCETDPRVGGRYRLVFGYEGTTAEFFGQYLEVTPPTRLVWTNDEAGDDGQVTTVTFEETDGRTLIVMHDLYPSKEALDEAIASGAISGPECLEQLDELLTSLGKTA